MALVKLQRITILTDTAELLPNEKKMVKKPFAKNLHIRDILICEICGENSSCLTLIRMAKDENDLITFEG
jgi:hypothetical protein